MDGLAAQVGRSPVQGRQLGFRLAVSSGSDDAARCLPGNPTALPLHSYLGRGMGDPLDAVVGMGDRRPLGADAEVDPAAAMRLAWVAGSVRDNRGHRHEEAAACSLRVIDSTRARPFVSSRTSRRVFSLLRSLPMTGRVR
jgi:hypothetical protein